MGQTCSAYLRKGDGGVVDGQEQWYYDASGLRPTNNQSCKGQEHLLFKRHRLPPQEVHLDGNGDEHEIAIKDTATSTTEKHPPVVKQQQEVQSAPSDAALSGKDDAVVLPESKQQQRKQEEDVGDVGIVVEPDGTHRDAQSGAITLEDPTNAVRPTTDPSDTSSPYETYYYPSAVTRLVLRTIPPREPDEVPGTKHQHVYAMRPPTKGGPEPSALSSSRDASERQEQRPASTATTVARKSKSMPTFPNTTLSCPRHLASLPPAELYKPETLAKVAPSKEVTDWVCVSPELNVYVCDTGLSSQDCDSLVAVTEHVCKGQYAAYTYAKQTLGCRDYPLLSRACWDPVSRVCRAIQARLVTSPKVKLQLDDREPHVVKYDVTKRERQSLDMHTDKSEWTFLIALSDGCGLDYEGGGTYFEGLDATLHVQRGHALIFPGKLRHCGIRIRRGLRFLLVGFLVDKNAPPAPPKKKNTKTTVAAATTTTTTDDDNEGEA